jgi:hypothetical protein
VRGGAAGGISAGGAVFRVRRVGDLVLLALQWLLMLWGIVLLAFTGLEYDLQSEFQQGLSVTGFESSLSAPPLHLRLIQGIATGLIAMGLSAILFYLRHLYLARGQ